jgi:hypothetical protein
MVTVLMDKLFRPGSVKCLVTLLCYSLLTAAWAGGARAATDDTINLMLAIEKQVPAMAISIITYADDTGEGPVLTNQVCELGEEPWASVVIDGMRIQPDPATSVLMTTKAKKLRLVMKLTGPSGKVATRTVIQEKPGAKSMTSLLLQLPGSPIRQLGHYWLSLTVTPVSKNQPQVKLKDHFIVVPKGFISIHPAPIETTRPLDPNGPIPVGVAFSTTGSSPIYLTNLIATVVLQKPNIKQGDWPMALQSMNHFSTLPRACSLMSESKRKYTLDLAQPNWEMLYVSATLESPLREYVKSPTTLDAYGKISGTYRGLKWYRIWKIGTLQFAPHN